MQMHLELGPKNRVWRFTCTDRLIGDAPILIAEAIAIQKALRIASYLNMDNLVMESDSYIVINSIVGRNKAPGRL